MMQFYKAQSNHRYSVILFKLNSKMNYYCNILVLKVEKFNTTKPSKH